ncbi:DNA sulfur modification protein DndD [Lysinibacillus sp. NPDC096212]|uniref:DNA sulfur modification protein DndD n=1 Tax=Lysinibacillus sp. NPDC096212 TaxID=3364135 RepID=UPI0037FBF848
MLLKRVTFNDFRLYKDFNEIDLTISGKNIILIGSPNGAGKTSILEGILLALYGSQAKLTSGETYDQFIRDCINTESYRKGNRKFYIEVEFEGNNESEKNLLIKREWRIRENDCIENLSITEDGQELKQFEDDLDKTQFIQNIIPFGVSQFFFFDGEKIQYMAEDNDFDSSDSLSSSIRDILNINIYHQLVEDLYSYEINQKRSQANIKLSDIRKVEAEIEATSEVIAEIEKELDDAQLSKVKLGVEMNEIKKWLREQGISSINKRADIQEEIEHLKHSREEIRDVVFSFIDNELPYVLLSPVINDIGEQLQKENQYNKAKMLSRQNHENFYLVLESLNSDKIIPPLTPMQKDILAQEMQLIWARINKPIIRENVEIIHDLSPSDLEVLNNDISYITSYLTNGNSDLEKTFSLFEKTSKDINEKIQLLKKLPTSDNVLKKESQLEEYEITIKSLEDNIRICQNNLDEQNNKKKTLLNSRIELIEQIKVTQEIQTKINESEKIRKALLEFINKLTIEKAHDVEQLLTEMFNKLTRKDYLVKRFKINPNTFDITFENMHNEVLPKRRLSAGEKEIFSISLVWALAKASQKPLPIVIDTPLGRLDKVHRTNLLTHYFPYASQQVIILSTDEEVADEWREMIKNNIAKEYLITDCGEKTSIKKGYFNLEVR